MVVVFTDKWQWFSPVLKKSPERALSIETIPPFQGKRQFGIRNREVYGFLLDRKG